VRLRALARSDQEEFLAAVAASRAPHRPWVHPPATPEQFRALLRRMRQPSHRGFVVRLRASDELVGFVEITHIVRGALLSGFLGYYVFAGFERLGLMREGLGLAVRHAFSTLRLHRLEANVQPGNRASIALVRSLGFEREGLSPRYLKIRGRWRDHERWAMVAGASGAKRKRK
jgi:ribosomal-protein-alanine N-acetyltransferase